MRPTNVDITHVCKMTIDPVKSRPKYIHCFSSVSAAQYNVSTLHQHSNTYIFSLSGCGRSYQHILQKDINVVFMKIINEDRRVS